MTEEVLGGGVGAGLSYIDFFLLGRAGVTICTSSLTTSAFLVAGDFATGNLGSRDRGSAGWGTVLDFLSGVINPCVCVMAGEVEDHERGVVVAVEALQGAGDSVKRVDGLLMVLMVDGGGGLVCFGT